MPRLGEAIGISPGRHGPEEQETGRGPPPGHQPQQIEGRRIAPVQVFEYQDQRLLGGSGCPAHLRLPAACAPASSPQSRRGVAPGERDAAARARQQPGGPVLLQQPRHWLRCPGRDRGHKLAMASRTGK